MALKGPGKDERVTQKFSTNGYAIIKKGLKFNTFFYTQNVIGFCDYSPSLLSYRNKDFC